MFQIIGSIYLILLKFKENIGHLAQFNVLWCPYLYACGDYNKS